MFIGCNWLVWTHLLERKVFKPFNCQKWCTLNFSLQYQYIMLQTGNENNQTYQLEVVIFI